VTSPGSSSTPGEHSYYMILTLQKRLCHVSRHVAVKNSSPTGNRPGATYASRRNLHHRSPSHIHLLSSGTTRVSRLMVATQEVKGKSNDM
jgi:hypothetical protein